MQRLFLASLWVLFLACSSAAIPAPHPQEAGAVDPDTHLGRRVGADFTLADWGEVSSFYEQLAAASPRVQLRRVGETTEGRDFLLAVISSEANLARLDELRAHAATIADPRGKDAAARRRAVDEGRPFVMVSLGMHSTETSPAQLGLELAWNLATSDDEPWARAREELVVLLLPCTNPDGLDEVVAWYRETVGTPYEAAGLARLYQRYAGHDNNRDWFMLSLAETRIVTRLLYKEWFPQVYWDVHQQGRSGERLFVPPFRDPLNPNLDPAIMASIGHIGARALLDLTREGFTGVATGVTYDMWWNGGNRNVPVRHNIVGLLTEAASVNLASPVFLRRDDLRGPRGLGGYAPSNRFPAPWPGGWWRMRDIIDYELAFARSLLSTVSSEPTSWLEGAMAAAKRTIGRADDGGVRGWVVPSDNRDPGAVRRLMDSLLQGGVELHVSDAELDLDGRSWPAGSIVIRRDQPYGSHVKDLFEVQRYPDGDPPYDVAGWTLPLLMGVHRVEVFGELPAVSELRPVASPGDAVAAFRGAAGGNGGLPAVESDTWPRVFERLGSGATVRWDDATGSFRFEAAPEGAASLAGLPRVGLYAPWSGSMDEGWLRWVFEEFELPYVTVRNEMLRAGRLDELLDVLVLPDVSERTLDRGRPFGSVPEELTGGLDPEGAVAIEEFVRAGGRLVALDASARWAIELFDLPLEDAARLEGVSRGEGDFACPGSVLRSIPAASTWTAGLPESIPLFFSRGSAWRVADGADAKRESEPEMLLSYAPTRLLLSGWARSPEQIAGAGAWVRARHGEGEVHLFGFSPHFRSWCQGTFGLLFRALVLDAQAEEQP